MQGLGKHRFGMPAAALALTTTESAASLIPCGLQI